MNDQIMCELEGVEGVVKWFDSRKGFGFIIGSEGQDIFTHFTVIQGNGFRALNDGAVVQYDAVRTGKGWKATKVYRNELVEVGASVRKTYSRTPRR